MREIFIKKSYIALFELLDCKYNAGGDDELGRLLSGMNPRLFSDGASADPAYYEDFCEHIAAYNDLQVASAFSASMAFLRTYCDDFGFDISKIIDKISFKEYEESFNRVML